MATAQGPGFIDKHIEKVILLICVIVLAYVVMTYVMGAHTRLEVGNQLLAPDEVDRALLEEAESVQTRYMNQKATDPPTIHADKLLKHLQDKPLNVALTAIVYGSPEEKLLRPGGRVDEMVTPSLQQVAEAMPAPSKPVVWMKDELSIQAEAGEGRQAVESLRESPSWHAVTVYPYGTLGKKWREAFKTSLIIPKAVPLGYEVQVEYQLPDGSWKTTDDVKFVRLPDARAGNRVVDMLPLPEFDGTNGEDIDSRLSLYLEKGYPAITLQPLYPTILSDDQRAEWTAGLPADFLKGVYPPTTETPGESPVRRTDGAGHDDIFGTPESAAPAAVPAATSRRRVRRAGPPEMFGPEMMGPPTARSRRVGADVAAGAEIPTMAQEFQAGKILAWAHATDLQYGRTYRLRFRLIFANPLLTHAEAVDKDYEPGKEIPADAKAPTVATKWSPWSDTMKLRREIDFFVTGANPLRNRLTVTIFAKALGQRVAYKLGSLTPGQAIRAVAEVQVVDPLTGELYKVDGALPKVDFDTGAVAIEFHFDRKVTLATGGVKNDAVEMIYADPQGKLCRRVMYFDRASETYEELMKEAEVTRKKFAPVITPKDKDDNGRPGRRTNRVSPEDRRMMPPEMIRPPFEEMPPEIRRRSSR